jgi:hypothetical protein
MVAPGSGERYAPTGDARCTAVQNACIASGELSSMAVTNDGRAAMVSRGVAAKPARRAAAAIRRPPFSASPTRTGACHRPARRHALISRPLVFATQACTLLLPKLDDNGAAAALIAWK